MVEENSDRGGASRLGLILLLLAALAVAGVLAWRALNAAEAAEDSAPVPSAEMTLDDLRKAAEADPDNPIGWLELGYAHFNQRDFKSAVTAYEKATKADPNSAISWSSLGEARVMASERDPMPQAALDAFKRALELEPTDPRSRYFMAVKKDIDKDHAGAIDDWLDLLAETPPGAPWEADLQRTIEQVGKINNIDTEARIAKALKDRAPIAAGSDLTAGAAIPGPSQEQIAAAGSMSPDEQRDMAVGMVESLEGKLKANPQNVDGWVMLMRSRMSLAEPDKAKAALDAAIAANPTQGDRLRSEAQILGVR